LTAVEYKCADDAARGVVGNVGKGVEDADDVREELAVNISDPPRQ